ncbi:hypothetical protein JW948_15260 [bacterium]|nr:hypothetical protein [bacterium]
MEYKFTEKQKHYIKKHMRDRSAEQIAGAIKADPDNVRTYIGRLNPVTSLKKQRLFSVIAASLPVLIILFIELILQLFRYGGDLRLFLPMRGDMSAYYQINSEVSRRYFFMQKTTPTPGRDLFLKKKPENGFRIFVLGGSTAAGFPYGNNLMFSRILGQRLDEAFPDKIIEVVNVSMSAVNSYTLLDFTDEVIRQHPDLVLIYAGHNEYYGAMGVGSMESLGRNPGWVRATLSLRKFRLFLLARNGIALLRKSVSKAVHGATEVDPTATLMARIVSNKTIPYGSALYKLGLKQFGENLDIMMTRFRKAGVPVVLSELVSNIRDQAPFISGPAGDLPPAQAIYDEARKLDASGKYRESMGLYTRAKDLDMLRFRASEELNALIHRMGETYRTPVVPMKAAFMAVSQNGLVGSNIMADHLHPNMDGYFVMADAFFNTLKVNGLIAAQWDSTGIHPWSWYRNRWGITALDTAEAELSIAYLKGGWPFQPESEPNHTLRDYHPATKAESLAVNILIDKDLNLEKGHMRLGEFYIRQKQYGPAFREYKALLTMVPHEMDFYERAAEAAIKMKDFDSALSICLKSLKLGERPFNTKWIGQIDLLHGNAAGAVAWLIKAAALAPEDTQVLFNLGRSYLVLGRMRESLDVYRRMHELEPGSQYTIVLGGMIKEARLKNKE